MSARGAVLVLLLGSTSLAAPGRLTTWLRGPDRLVAGAPAAVRISAQRSTSRDSLAPWPGARVEVLLEGHGRREVIGTSVADDAGEASARLAVPLWPDGEYSLVIAATAGAAHSTTRHAVTLTPSAKLLLQSDKPLYQPGQTVHLRVLAMRPFDARPLAGAPVQFEVYDPRGNRIALEQRPASAFGVACWDFELGPEVTLGAWRVRATSTVPGATAAEVELGVERYALPKFKVALDTDQPWYRPGATVTLAVEARYFFGKPVARGAVRARLTAASEVRVVLHEAQATLDAEGRAAVRLQVPAGAPGQYAVAVEVTDTAEHLERASRSLTVAQQGLVAELVTEGPSLVAGVKNELWVIAARPDGSPLGEARVELVAAEGSPVDRAVTDASGVAALWLQPAGPTGCLHLRAAVTRAGETVVEERCVAVVAAPARTCPAQAPPGRPHHPDGAAGADCERWPLLLRADRALYPSGAPLVLEVLSPGASGTVLVDVVKDALTVDTARVTVVDGRGTLTLPADERRFGTLALQASWVHTSATPPQQRARAQRLVYVERPGALQVTATATRAGEIPTSFAPGEAAHLTLKVVDAASGAPVRASVGVVMVDKALLALRPVRPAMARAYFNLSKAATAHASKLKARPGGGDLAALVERGATDDASDLAARVLLAGASPPWDVGFEADGFAALVEEAARREDRLDEAVEAYQRGHLLGEREPGTRAAWRWRHDLAAQLVADRALRASDAWDPWGAPVSAERLTQRLGDFSAWAEGDVSDRLTRVYRALFAELKAGRLTVSSDRKPVVTLTQADLDRLFAEQRLGAEWAVDPWGNPWRVRERKKLRWIAGLRATQVVASDGPDGLPDTRDDVFPADASAWGELAVTASVGDARGYGGLGLRGGGAGGGGVGEASIILGARAGRSVSVFAPSPLVLGAEPRTPARVRSDFPETLLWRPELLTDAQGQAQLDVALADSVTTWVLSADAVAADGRLGATTAELQVKQDFFADLDLPPVMTQHDELSVPVAVYNFLPTPQQVTLRLVGAEGFEVLSEPTQRLDLAPQQVGVRSFRVRAQRVGRRALTVQADSGAVQDAVRREVEIFPDGVERVTAWQDRLSSAPVAHELLVPATAIAGTPRATLKLYPGLGAQAVDGLENLLRLPAGCFEQSSSATYPNALILDYLRKTKHATPEVEARARRYLAAGYQKLVSFEVRGGGFSWFGEAPANAVLTAYGLEEFVDMAKVYPVDPQLIARTRQWLVDRQAADGHWPAEPSPINEGATDHYQRDTVRTTAYLALALLKADAPRDAVARAARYVTQHLGADADAYTLALANELVAGLGAPALGERLWAARSGDPAQRATAHFAEGAGATLTHGRGRSGDLETTARAALSLLASRSPSERVEQAVAYLVGNKDPGGTWYTTQATIRALQALLRYEASRAQERAGTVRVALDGRDVATVAVSGAAELTQTVELPAEALAGAHQVTLRYQGTGELTYQLVSRYHEPRGPVGAPAAAPLTVHTTFSASEVKVGDELEARVVVTALAPIAMPVVTAGLPPGFQLDDASLEKLVLARTIDKYERGAREVTFYLSKLDAGALELPFRLVARMPALVQAPAPTVYEYYQPENAAAGRPVPVGAHL